MMSLEQFMHMPVVLGVVAGRTYGEIPDDIISRARTGNHANRACQEFCVRGIKMSIRTKYATQNETIYGAAADSERVT